MAADRLPDDYPLSAVQRRAAIRTAMALLDMGVRVRVDERGFNPETGRFHAPMAEPAYALGLGNGHMLQAAERGARVLFKALGAEPCWLWSHKVRLGHR